jgi:hypothetical protein
MTHMSAPLDPAEFAPPRDAADYRPRPIMSRGFWVAIGFTALSLMAAAGVVLYAGRGSRLAAPATATRVIAPSPPAPPVLPAVTSTTPPQVADLDARVRRLEDGESRALDAAAEALAAAGLSDAAAEPRPFADTLSAFQRILPASAGTAALRALALQGAPTRAELAADLSRTAARVAVEARAPAKNAMILDQIAYALSRIVSIRRLDPTGPGPDAVIVRAQRLADQGDLPGAVGALDAGLSPPARAALQGWREQALRRIAIDEAIAGLRVQAVADLALARAARP